MALSGVALALCALIFWGVADFLIQRSTRLVGSITTMLFIGIVAILITTPFAYQEIFSLSATDFFLLLSTGIVLTAASLFDFEALRKGKMAVAEPIVGLETPFTVLVAFMLASESPSLLSLTLIGVTFLGTTLIAVKHISFSAHKKLFEKGARLAIGAAFGLAVANFMIGEASRSVSSVSAMWWIGAVHTVFALVYLVVHKRVRTALEDVAKHPKTVGGQAIIDTLGWLSFATAMTLAPIAIVSSISSGYIALAVLLGIFITRERMLKHQWLGVALVVIGIGALSYFFG